MELDEQKILITGASRGIGRAVAFECARQGAVVGVNYLASERDAAGLAEEITASGHRHPVPGRDLPASVVTLQQVHATIVAHPAAVV